MFSAINTFLDENPTEVIMIPLQLNSQVDRPVDLWSFYNVTNEEVPGFSDKFYIHPNLIADWPPLREVIAANKVSNAMR